MKTFKNLYPAVCSSNNLYLAFRKARKRKTLKSYVIEFEKAVRSNLLQLQVDLLFHSYKPKPLQTFILRDPKTRKISKSAFRDRVLHHALHNVIQPIFEKSFIHDSYANRVGKGTLAAIRRFEYFKRKVSRNYTKVKDGKNIKGFVLKADIRHFFETVDHQILVSILNRKIKDERVMWLVKTILSNYNTPKEGKGMPLGNLTSQFFANVYLDVLDQFVKHDLKVKCYIRYVDDFVILHRSSEHLQWYKAKIDSFLEEKLKLQLHPEKSRIFPIYKGTSFLGQRIFAHHRLLKKSNIKKSRTKLKSLCIQYDNGLIDYDKVYNFLEGWIAYSRNANTYKFRKNLLKDVEETFAKDISTKEINRHIKQVRNNPTNLK